STACCRRSPSPTCSASLARSSSGRHAGETPAACAAPPGCGRGGELFALALRGRRAGLDLREAAPEPAFSVVDVQLAADAVGKEQERQLVDGYRIALVRSRLEIGDRHRPGGDGIERFGILHRAQRAVGPRGLARADYRDRVVDLLALF